MSGYTQDSMIGVEPKASGKSIVQNIKAQTMLNIFETSNPDSDKTTRAHSVTKYCEMGRVKLVEGPYIERWLDQITTFPNVSHDEYIDLLVMSINEFLINDTDDVFWI